MATAQLAAGDVLAAGRALDYLLTVQERKDGSFPQNSTLDGTAIFPSLQLDEVAFPLILAWQLGRADPTTYRTHLKRAADFLVANGPATQQERWEEASGYSPATIAAEIAGLVCAADIARRNGDAASSLVYLGFADRWRRSVDRWTYTTSGPLPPHYEEEWKASGGSFVVLSGIQWKMLMDAFDAAKATVENLTSGTKRDFDLRGAKTLTLDLSKGPLAAVLDPNPIVNGTGAQLLREHGISVTLGERADEARALLQGAY